MDGVCSNWSAGACKVKLCTEEHSYEAGLAHSTWTVDQELVIAMWNVTFLESSMQDFFSWI